MLANLKLSVFNDAMTLLVLLLQQSIYANILSSEPIKDKIAILFFCVNCPFKIWILALNFLV